MGRTAPGEGEARKRRQRTHIVEVDDERDPLAEQALELIAESFPRHERQPRSELRSELMEKRLGLLTAYNFHLLATVGEDERPLAVIFGIYLAGINAGFIAYLASRPEARGKRYGRRLREALIEAFREDARRAGRKDLAWVLGEVPMKSPWLRRLVREGGAIPFDLTYFFPGLRGPGSEATYVLYREPVGDKRTELPVELVRRILYAIWRRAYRVRHPLEREDFRTMLAELEGRATIGPHPEVLRLAERKGKRES